MEKSVFLSIWETTLYTATETHKTSSLYMNVAERYSERRKGIKEVWNPSWKSWSHLEQSQPRTTYILYQCYIYKKNKYINANSD